MHSYLSNYVPEVLSAARRDPAAARSLAITLVGKRLVDGIRARTAALESAVSRRQTERQQISQSSADSAVAEAIAVLVALTLLTVLLGAFLGRLALARDRARTRSEYTAEILQRSLLPHALPSIPGCELAIRFAPAGAGELVGGDFYDVFALGHGRWAIVLGDVCGKGAEAAAITAMARWTLRSYIPEADDPKAVDARGPLLGVWPDLDLHTDRLELMPGDGLVAYTDGVTDQGPGFSAATPSAMLGEQGTRPSAERLATALEQYANRLHGPQQDDVAIVAVRFRGDAGEHAAGPAQRVLDMGRGRR